MLVEDDLVQRAEHLGLQRLVLDDRFDHHLAIGHVAEVGREREVRDGCVALLFRELAGAHATIERTDEPLLTCLGRRGIDLADDHVEAGATADLRDAGAHEAAADDADS